MGRAGQILQQCFSTILSNRKRFNLWDGISSPYLLFVLWGSEVSSELALSKCTLQRSWQKRRALQAVEMCCLVVLGEVCACSWSVEVSSWNIWFGQKVEEGAAGEGWANSVRWGTAHCCRGQRVREPALVTQSNRGRTTLNEFKNK